MTDNRTAKQIAQDILSRLEDIDTRQSSSSYQTVGAVSLELRNLFLQLGYAMRMSFIGTAEGEYLDTLAEQFKFKREPSTKAIVKAEIIGNKVPIGNRFASVNLPQSIIYKVTEDLGENNYFLQAEDLNDEVNFYTGDIAIIDYITDISSAKITEITFPQKAEEDDEQFRKRIENNLIAEATDGNVAQYEKWLRDFEGIGKSKVKPKWNGVNTVKCTILNDINKSASEELIEKVQNYLDPNKQGLGEGKAPIGAVVTVDTTTDLPINIVLKVTYKEGKSSAPTLKTELNKFFEEIAFERTVVSYLQIAGVISNNENINFISSLTLNGQKKDIPISETQTAILGTLDISTGDS